MGNLGVIKVDDAGLIKLNSLATGKLDIPASAGIFKKNEVPYNKLLDRGYKSVADWHSTKPIAEGEDESAGRWKGQQETECGMHNPGYSHSKV